MTEGKLSKLSNWDLTSTYITKLWDCRINVVETRDRQRLKLYDEYMRDLHNIRDELMRRLENTK